MATVISNNKDNGFKSQGHNITPRKTLRPNVFNMFCQKLVFQGWNDGVTKIHLFPLAT